MLVRAKISDAARFKDKTNRQIASVFSAHFPRLKPSIRSINKQTDQTTMAKSPKVKSTQTKAPKTNEKGEIISWDSSSADGKALRALFDGGLITNETAKQVKKSFPMFRNYANRTLNSALNNERKRVEKEVDTQKARGSSGELEWLLWCPFSCRCCY